MGQTRSKVLIERLKAEGIGECTVRGELPPRRLPWFFDNGAFRDWKKGSPFNAAKFLGDVRRIRAESLAPDFVVVPDVVARGLASLTESLSWLAPLAGLAPLYLALQDGMTETSVATHVDSFAGLFVGGTKDWKLETGGAWVEFAHARGKPCHIGRVGSGQRVRWAIDVGADSIDSSLPLFAERNLKPFLQAIHHSPVKRPKATQGRLFDR